MRPISIKYHNIFGHSNILAGVSPRRIGVSAPVVLKTTSKLSYFNPAYSQLLVNAGSCLLGRELNLMKAFTRLNSVYSHPQEPTSISSQICERASYLGIWSPLNSYSVNADDEWINEAQVWCKVPHSQQYPITTKREYRATAEHTLVMKTYCFKRFSSMYSSIWLYEGVGSFFSSALWVEHRLSTSD